MAKLLDKATGNESGVVLGPVIECNGPTLLVASGVFGGGYVNLSVSVDGENFVDMDLHISTPKPVPVNYPGKYLLQAKLQKGAYGHHCEVSLVSNQGKVIKSVQPEVVEV